MRLIFARINIISAEIIGLYVFSQECVHCEWTIASSAFVLKTNRGFLLRIDRRQKTVHVRLSTARVNAGRLRPVSRFVFCMINVQVCGCFAYPALTNAHNSPQRHRSSWLMRAINCSRALKIGRIYISQGMLLPLSRTGGTKRISLEFTYAFT